MNDPPISRNGGTTSHGSAIAAGLSGRQLSARQAAAIPASASRANGSTRAREPAKSDTSFSIVRKSGRVTQAICFCSRCATSSSGPSTITAAAEAASQRSGIRPIRRPGPADACAASVGQQQRHAVRGQDQQPEQVEQAGQRDGGRVCRPPPPPAVGISPDQQVGGDRGEHRHDRVGPGHLGVVGHVRRGREYHARQQAGQRRDVETALASGVRGQRQGGRPPADGRGERGGDDHGAQRGEPQGDRRGAGRGRDYVHEDVVGAVHGVLVPEQGEDLADGPRDRVLGVGLVPPERGPADLVPADHERGGRGNGDNQPVDPSPRAPRGGRTPDPAARRHRWRSGRCRSGRCRGGRSARLGRRYRRSRPVAAAGSSGPMSVSDTAVPSQGADSRAGRHTAPGYPSPGR